MLARTNLGRPNRLLRGGGTGRHGVMNGWAPLAGVVLAQFVLVGLYFAKLRADDRRRWSEKQLDAYRALSRAARSASHVFAMAEEPEDLDDRRFVDAMNDADACMLDIDLLTPAVRDAATAVSTILEMCVVLDPDSDAFPSASDLLQARLDFERAVRTELRVQTRDARLSREDRKPFSAVELHES